MKTASDLDPRRLLPWIIYVIFFALLNETMFNVATPLIAEHFTLGPSGVSWMMSSFMVFFGIGAVIYGRLSDVFGLRKLIIIGIAIYAAGSVAGFLLRFSYPLVVVARALQGIGGSAIPALVFVVVARHFPESERGRIFGLITSTVSFAIGLGPVVGGFLAARFGWSVLFLVPLFILASLPAFSVLLPKEARRSGSVDVPGAALVTLAIGSLIVYLNLGAWYWLCLFAGATAAAAMRMSTAAEPFIKPSLFRNARFSAGTAAAFLLFSIVIGMLFLIPLMLSDVHGLGPRDIGFILFPGAISSVIFGPIGGTIADRRGNSFVVALGLGLLLASLAFMSFVLSRSVALVALALLLMYVGFSLFQTAMVNGMSQALPQDEIGVGMGIFNLVGIVSGALGTAVVGKLLALGVFDFSLFGGGADAGAQRSRPYSNLMLAFTIVVLLGGALYLRSFRASPSAVADGEPEPRIPACATCES